MGHSVYQNAAAKLRTSLFLYRTDTNCEFTVTLKEHSFWLPLVLRCLCQVNLDTSTSLGSQHIEATLEKSRERWALPFCNFTWTPSATYPYKTQPGLHLHCMKWKKKKNRKEKQTKKSPQNINKPIHTLGSLAFSQLSGLDSCRFSKWLFLCYLACPSHLLCLVAFSVLHLLIPTLRICSPLP